MFCLITNYHVISEQILNNNEFLEILLNHELLKINLKRKRKIWTKKALDFTCIEILKNENIIDIINPFEINDDCYDK